MTLLLRRLFLASLRHRPLAAAWSLAAIALGVALGLAVQLIQTAARDELGRGLRLVSGVADLQAVGPGAGFDDALYPLLARHPAVAAASPVLEIEARLPGRERTLRILGVDPLRLARVAPELLPAAAAPDGADDRFAAFRPDALFLSPAAARALGLQPGDGLEVQVGTGTRRLRIAGGVPGAGMGQRLAVMDIAAAQQVFGRLGRISHVALRLADGLDRARVRDQLQALLPPGVVLRTPDAARAEVLGLSRAYQVNLTMLAAMALVTGGFLVFSTQWLAVARRRQEFALLRALGLDRAGLRRGLLAEGALLGLIGGLCGLALGCALAALALTTLGGDLGAGFFRELQPRLTCAPGLLLLYLALGIGAGLAGAWWPAREAARLIPARGLRAGDETAAYRARPRWGAVLLCLAGALLAARLPALDGVPVAGYLAVLLLLAAAVLSLPGLAALALRRWPAGRGVLWRLARARLAAAPGQTAVAGAGVVASVALAGAMAIMVSSFRTSVDDWLTAMLPADLYLRAAAAGTSGALDPAAVARVAALPGVTGVRPVRFTSIRPDPGADAGALELIARPVGVAAPLPLVAGTMRFAPAGTEPDPARPAWLSEAAADRLGLGVGDPLPLPLAGRTLAFQVVGIWRDYARQQGAIVIDLQDYRTLTGDWDINDLGVFLAVGTAPEPVMAAIRATLGERVSELILPGALRAMILAVFDRTFLVTYLMEGVAILIGLSGIVATFAALAGSRRREFGMLRHLGMPRRRIGRLLALEGLLTAALSVGVGLAAGGAIAVVLIEVINRQSFRWSMELQLPFGALALFALAMVLLAALAARLAGAQAMRQPAVLAVREDW